MALRGHGGAAAPCDVFYAVFFFFFFHEILLRPVRPERLTLILIYSKTSRKRKALFLLKAGHSQVGGGCL